MTGYTYAADDPVNGEDPTGTQRCIAAEGFCGNPGGYSNGNDPYAGNSGSNAGPCGVVASDCYQSDTGGYSPTPPPPAPQPPAPATPPSPPAPLPLAPTPTLPGTPALPGPGSSNPFSGIGNFFGGAATFFGGGLTLLGGIATSSGVTIAGGTGIGIATPLLGPGSAYSVAYEMKLASSMYPGLSRKAHFQAANAALLSDINSDPNFAAAMDALIPGIKNLLVGSRGAIIRNSPSTLWTWHHAAEEGIMQLVPRIQHEAAGVFQNFFHRGGAGGYSIWG